MSAIRAAAATTTLALCAAAASGLHAQRTTPRASGVRILPVGVGWARSSVNAVIFRTSSVVTHGRTQYTAYYDDSAHVVLAKRDVDSTRWQIERTAYTNDVTDAHNAISLGVDGRGVLHVAWAVHNKALHYARAVAPGSLTLGEPTAMTGQREEQVTYPQFYPLPSGDLLFVYRDGRSGSGDVLLDRYDVKRGTWRALHHPLIAGEGQRNAYVNQLAVDTRGGWHVSWVWRESPDVATNHDVLYAYSPDEGRSWRTSRGVRYALPITSATAEVAWAVPQGSELINQTSMTVSASGRPMIATYWRSAGSDVPQLQLVWHDGTRWRASQVGARTTPFRLSGGGTKRIPISRPQVLAGKTGAVYVVYRDAERGGGITVARSADAVHTHWSMTELLASSVGQWEPTYDPTLWGARGRLALQVQRVGQGDGEALEDVAPQMVSILEWTP
ncbi:MAG TPA: BNR repeat-containing protein [Gemmatimonadaceae bacterium]|nr:BNR repeat-containing protein [Gemmatimonadaceae bacterium]